MGRRFVRFTLFAIVLVVGVRACQDWQAKRATQAARRTQPSLPGATASQPWDSPAATAPATASTPGGGATSAERTRQMEEQARSIQQQYDAMRNTPMTDAERERAAQQLLEQQRQLANQGQSPP